MLRLSKKVEYGLIALRHIAICTNGHIVTAKEISEIYHIPYGLLAKVLQKLAKAGLIFSHQGVHGGYKLAGNPSQVVVSRIISTIEGTTPMIAQCMADGPESCGVFDTCTIKSPLQKVQANIEQVFDTMTLAEIV